MKATTQTTPPKLAAPGAGLPAIEHFFANLMVRWKAGRTGRVAATATFAKESEAVLHLLATTPADQLRTPVLIRRLPGLEDSSRYWSVLMTVDHLRIVNDHICGVMASLCAGKVPDRAASTAAVKPDDAVGASVIPVFKQSCCDFNNMVAAQGDLKTEARFDHPWFGPMDAAGWHFMAGFHMSLHRRQMERILTGLKR